MNKKYLLFLGILAAFGAGCAPTPPPPIPLPSPEPVATTTQEVPSSTQAIYEDYTPQKFAEARAAGEPIFLYFYASWCPFCQEQDPRNALVFKNFKDKVHGFRVNYDTEHDLIKEFRVITQHTSIFLDRDGKEVERVIGTQTSSRLEEALRKIVL